MKSYVLDECRKAAEASLKNPLRRDASKIYFAAAKGLECHMSDGPSDCKRVSDLYRDAASAAYAHKGFIDLLTFPDPTFSSFFQNIAVSHFNKYNETAMSYAEKSTDKEFITTLRNGKWDLLNNNIERLENINAPTEEQQRDLQASRK